jgi:hypothetical protein
MGANQGKVCEVMVLDDAPNATVVKLPWRQFPGMLFQADSLKILHDDLTAAIDALRKRAVEDAVEELMAIRESVGALVSRYEAAMQTAGLSCRIVGVWGNSGPNRAASTLARRAREC